MGPLALFVGVAAALLVAVVSWEKWVQHRWRLTARRLGLRFQPGTLQEGDRILGERGRYLIEVTNRHRRHTSVLLHAAHLPSDLHIAPRTRRPTGEDTRAMVGADRFDRAVQVTGRADEIHARLTTPAREAIAAAVAAAEGSTASIVITGRRVMYDVEYRVEPSTRIEEIIARLEAVADALRLTRSVPEQLSANLFSAAEPGRFRRRCLAALTEYHADHAATRQACRRLLDDEGCRLRRHRSRGAPEAVVGDDESALRARRDPLERLADEIVREPSDVVRWAVARSLAAIESIEPELLFALTRDESPRVAEAAIVGLARTFEPRPSGLDAVLADALQREAYPVRLAAVEALAVNGSRAAIEPLRAVLRASFFDHQLRRAARTAIRAIELRCLEGEEGRLSLAAEELSCGHLSESPAGALTEVPTRAR